MGDSYSAGSGVFPHDPLAPPLCARSLKNYPRVIAQFTGASLRDVTCGGAQTKDFFVSQHLLVAPQLNALRPTTDLVTMTIGGNDSMLFAGMSAKCAGAGLTTFGHGSPCRDRYGSTFQDTIREVTYPAVVRALEAVHTRAPDARVAILGTPWLLPPTKGCYARMPIATGDVPYVREVQATLNDAFRRAAVATGTTYVDMSEVSEGHDACQPAGVRWVEPFFGTLNPALVHPNALGERAMGEQAMEVLDLR